MSKSKKKPEPKPDGPEYWHGWKVEKGVVPRGPV